MRTLRAGAACASIAVMVAGLGAYVVATSAVPQEKTIRIVSERFNYSPAEITVRKGVPVILQFTTKDVLMGFNLPDFEAKVDIVPGKVARLRLVPDKTGTFVFLCDVFCGAGHEEMNGRLIVVD
jgi:cytochrome c oxidase subunit 2